jgi:enamine deaminase RidA (YjgF/YER057c/UK114 family)
MRRALGKVKHGGGRMGWGVGAVASGTFVFLSGTPGRDPKTDLCPPTMGEQTLICWDVIADQLAMAGTSCANIVQRMTFVTDMDEWFSHARAFQTRWLTEHCPDLLENEAGSTLIGIQRLALRDMKIEIQVIAVVPD